MVRYFERLVILAQLNFSTAEECSKVLSEGAIHAFGDNLLSRFIHLKAELAEHESFVTYPSSY